MIYYILAAIAVLLLTVAFWRAFCWRPTSGRDRRVCRVIEAVADIRNSSDTYQEKWKDLRDMRDFIDSTLHAVDREAKRELGINLGPPLDQKARDRAAVARLTKPID